MIVKKSNIYHKLLFFASLLLLLFPAAQISGPFLTDIFLILISIIFIFICIKNKQYGLFKNNFFITFFFYYLFLVIGSLLSNNIALSIQSSVSYIRFGIFSLAVSFILINNKSYLKYFYMFLFFTLTILVFDGYFQFFLGKNIFGFAMMRPDRLGGLFFDHLILGSYLSKILPIFFTYAVINKRIINLKYFFLISFLSYILIFLSGERAVFFLFTFYLILISPFFLNIKKFLIIFLSITTFLIALILLNKNLKSRYMDQMLIHTFKKSNESSIFMPEHIGLFASAIDIFNRNFIFGSGVKTFRVECMNINQNESLVRKLQQKMSNISFCSTHPHNYYLQLLAETGIFSFLFIFYIFLRLCFSYIKQIYYLYNNKQLDKSYACILSGLIVAIWPLTTTGSFFNNWVCSTIFFTIGLCLFTLSNEIKNKL